MFKPLMNTSSLTDYLLNNSNVNKELKEDFLNEVSGNTNYFFHKKNFCGDCVDFSRDREGKYISEESFMVYSIMSKNPDWGLGKIEKSENFPKKDLAKLVEDFNDGEFESYVIHKDESKLMAFCLKRGIHFCAGIMFNSSKNSLNYKVAQKVYNELSQ